MLVGTANLPNLLHRLAVLWTALTFVPYWLPFFRGIMDGSDYQWGHFGFGGSGVDGDFWLVALLWILCLALLWAGTQGPRVVFRVLAPLWHLFLFATAAWFALTTDQPLMFRGDTLGIAWDITWAGPALYGAGLALAVSTCWTRLAVPVPGRARWTQSNTRRLWLLVALVPIQFALLRSGPMHGATDAIGVVLLIIQLMLLPWALSPKRWSQEANP